MGSGPRARPAAIGLPSSQGNATANTHTHTPPIPVSLGRAICKYFPFQQLSLSQVTDAAGPGCVFLGDLALQRGGRESPVPAHDSPRSFPGVLTCLRFGILHAVPRRKLFPPFAVTEEEQKENPSLERSNRPPLLLTCPRTFISWKPFAAAGRVFWRPGSTVLVPCSAAV